MDSNGFHRFPNDTNTKTKTKIKTKIKTKNNTKTNTTQKQTRPLRGSGCGGLEAPCAALLLKKRFYCIIKAVIAMKKIVMGILAHVDSGKTTLSEAMLYLSGSIQRLGRVDHGDSFLDNFYLERSRGITIFSKQATLNCKNSRITLLDTPGHVDFSAETERALQALDYAVLVISGADGVQSHSVTLWKLLRRYRVPTFIFVNKMDLDGADKGTLMSLLREKLSPRCVDFSDEDSDALSEEIAVCDEALLEKYYSSGITADDIAAAVRARAVFPCLFGSALKLIGIEKLLSAIDRYACEPERKNGFAAKVFKISEDGGNRLSWLKLTGGRLRVRDVLQSPNNKNGEKVTQIRVYSGGRFSAVDEVTAGDVCAVTGVSFTRSGDGLGEEKDSAIPVLEPVLTYRLELPDGVDARVALEKMRILEAEDPALNVEWNETLGEIQLRLMGEIQLEILSAVIRERFGFEARFGRGNIIYKETIKDTVEGVGHFEPLRHYAEVHLILKPLKRGGGLVFNSDCREDQLDRNWQRLILTHLYEKTHVGVLTGSPITDMEITLASGKAHPKHTEGGDFRQATYRAVRQGLRKAESVLLEPVYDFTLELPNDCVGRAMTDISRMSGTLEPPESGTEFTVIRGSAPVSEMREYNSEVLRYTRGEGRLSLSFKGYEECRNADEVIAEIGYDPDSDVINTADSVFCSHGAGHNVRWDEVASRMHLPSALSPLKQAVNKQSAFKKLASQKDIFALDKELMGIFEQTYGPVRRKKAPETKRTVTALDSAAKKYRPEKEKPIGTEYVLVDGYNVIFSWDELRGLAEDNIDAARSRLINILCNYQGYKKCELILVFDAYKVKGAGREVERAGGISIVYTKEAETADMYIEKVSKKLSKNNLVRVVTSDGLEQLIILAGGALRVPSKAFFEEVREAENEIRTIINEK